MKAMLKVVSGRPFLWRRLHSLMGLWLVLFLVEHLLTNSQAALWLGEDGLGFVTAVNALHNLPYLGLIEAFLLGIPILIHLVFGVRYALTAKSNTKKSDGSSPSIPSSRNRAYSWQRITSWVLLVGLLFHIVQFRFMYYPEKCHLGGHVAYLTPLSMDEGLYTLADRLDVSIYDRVQIAKMVESSSDTPVVMSQEEVMQHYDLIHGPIPEPYLASRASSLGSRQRQTSEAVLAQRLDKYRLNATEIVAVSSDFGTATLLVVRQTFKSPIYIVGYTLFVLAAAFHACNGFWSFLLTWGWVLKASAQRAWVFVMTLMMLGLMFLGLAAIWGSYWINLKS